LRASAIPNFVSHGVAQPPALKLGTNSLAGAGLTAATAFLLVYLIHWSRSRPNGFSKSRFLLVIVIFAAVASIVYGYVRRQWLHYLRQQAVDGASALVTNLQTLETSTSSALALIQEVELVSRGYRL
jgi:ABC-type Fe3+-siderophore transport system permease subunit